jgi:hypothetical protein
MALTHEYKRLDRQLQSKTQQLDALLAANGPAGEFPVDFEGLRYRRYSVDLLFTPSPLFPPVEAGTNEDINLLPQEKDFKVDEGTVFRCAYVESFLRATGTANDPYSGAATTVSVTLPWEQRLELFDFMWRIRDTGSDQEWCDQPQPSLFLGGGYAGPLWFPRRRPLSGGTVVVMRIEPFRNLGDTTTNSNFFTGGTIQQYSLHVSFVGHEEPDRGPL